MALPADPPELFASEAEGAADARRRNAELGRRGGGYSDFWTAVQRDDGRWGVEYRRVKVPWYRRLLDGLLEHGGFG